MQTEHELIRVIINALVQSDKIKLKTEQQAAASLEVVIHCHFKSKQLISCQINDGILGDHHSFEELKWLFEHV